MEFGRQLSSRSAVGLEAGYFAPVDRKRRIELEVTSGGTPTVDITQRDEGNNRFYYLGPYWRGRREGPALIVSYGVGAGAAVQRTQARSVVIDHLQSDAAQITEHDYTHVNAALSFTLALDLKVTNALLIGVGIRDLGVLRRKDTAVYPVDELRPGNSVIPYLSLRLRW
jgi:hypothetical protein